MKKIFSLFAIFFFAASAASFAAAPNRNGAQASFSAGINKLFFPADKELEKIFGGKAKKVTKETVDAFEFSTKRWPGGEAKYSLSEDTPRVIEIKVTKPVVSVGGLRAGKNITKADLSKFENNMAKAGWELSGDSPDGLGWHDKNGNWLKVVVSMHETHIRSISWGVTYQ